MQTRLEKLKAEYKAAVDRSDLERADELAGEIVRLKRQTRAGQPSRPESESTDCDEERAP